MSQSLRRRKHKRRLEIRSLPRELLSKPISKLTEEEKKILREWLYKTRSKRSIAQDIRKVAHIPIKVKTWVEHPNRYDIPGVDTSEALQKYVHELGYKPKKKKVAKPEKEIEKEPAKIEVVEEKKKEPESKESGKESKLFENLVKAYDLSKIEEIYPGFLEVVENGLNVLRKISVNDLAKILEELLKEYNIPYNTKELAKEIASSIKEAVEKEDYGEYIDTVTHNFDEAPSIEISLLYYLGKWGTALDRESLRRKLKEYIAKLKHIARSKGKETSETSTWLEYLERISRSQHIMNKGLTTLMYLDILENSDVFKTLISEAEKEELSNTFLHNIIFNVVREKKKLERGLWRKHYMRKVVEPTNINEFISVVDTIKSLYDILKLVHAKPEDVKKILEHNALPLRFDGYEVKITTDKDSINLTLLRNGKKITSVSVPRGEIRYYILNTSPSTALSSITLAYEKLFKNIGYNVVSRNDVTIIYRFVDKGIELIYPESRIYTWNQLPEFIKKYKDLEHVIMQAKENAREHGYDYPGTPTTAVKWIYKSSSPKIWIVEDVDGRIYLLVRDKWGAMDIALEADNMEEFKKKLKTAIESGKLNSKYTATLINWLKTHGVEIGRQHEEIARIQKIINATLGNVSNGTYITPDRILAVVMNNASENDLAKGLRKLEEKAIPVTPSNIKVVINGKEKSLNEVKLSEAKKASYNNSYVKIEVNGVTSKYTIDYMLPLLKKHPPKKIYIVGKDAPAILEYPEYKIYIAPRA